MQWYKISKFRDLVKKFTGGKFSINTSPLRVDHENSGKYKKVIVVGADKMSSIVDYSDRQTFP